MKISKIIALLLLIVCSACSKKEANTQVKSEPQAEPEKSGITDVIKREAVSIESAKQTLDESKQINQTIMNSAAQQRETIEKTSNGTGQ
jgi:hypothetical protein